MSPSGWYRRLVQSLELSSGFELFFLLGPGALARPGLAELSRRLARFGESRWHALHREGFEGLIGGVPQRGLLHLVHGLERMPAAAASELMARLNLNRDRLRELDAPILFWVPVDSYEEVLRQAPDLVAWRSQVDVVSADELGVGARVLERERDAMTAELDSALEASWDPRAEPADVGVLVALDEDFRVLREYVGELYPARNELGHEDYVFEIPADEGRPYRCVTTLVEHMGLDAELQAQRAIRAWNPTTVVSLGLAGSLDGEVARLGDVLLVREIVTVDDAVTHHRAVAARRSWHADEALYTDVRTLEWALPDVYERWRHEAALVLGNLSAQSTGLEHLIRGQSMRAAPIVRLGAVVTSRPVASERVEGTMAVAMEGSGSFGYASMRHEPPALVLRGISDIIDGSKPDATLASVIRGYAMGNVVRLLVALLRSGLFPRASTSSAKPHTGPARDRDGQQSELERLARIRAQAVRSARMADALIEQGELDRALRALRDETLPGFEQLGDLRSLAETRERIAELLVELGERDEALRTYREQVLVAHEQLGDVRSWAVTVGRIAELLSARGELEPALALRREQELPAYERLGDTRACAVTTGRIAELLLRCGELEQALQLREERELVLYEQLGDEHARAVTLGRIADLLAQRGDLEQALRIRREQERPVYGRLGDRHGHALSLAKIEALTSRASIVLDCTDAWRTFTTMTELASEPAVLVVYGPWYQDLQLFMERIEQRFGGEGIGWRGRVPHGLLVANAGHDGVPATTADDWVQATIAASRSKLLPLHEAIFDEALERAVLLLLANNGRPVSASKPGEGHALMEFVGERLPAALAGGSLREPVHVVVPLALPEGSSAEVVDGIQRKLRRSNVRFFGEPLTLPRWSELERDLREHAQQRGVELKDDDIQCIEERYDRLVADASEQPQRMLRIGNGLHDLYARIIGEAKPVPSS